MFGLDPVLIVLAQVATPAFDFLSHWPWTGVLPLVLGYASSVTGRVKSMAFYMVLANVCFFSPVIAVRLHEFLAAHLPPPMVVP